MADELRQPLKQRRFGDRFKALRPTRLLFASVMAASIAIAAGTWLAVTPYPMAGEPVVTVKVAPLSDPVETSSVSDSDKAAEDAAKHGDLAPADAPKTPQITIVGGDEASLPPLPSHDQSLTPAPQRSVSQKGPFGLLPRISGSGRTPLDVYARDVDPRTLASKRPKVALLIGGMGINAELTLRAIAELPGTVSFAFAPYGKDLQKLVDKARAAGHEAFLQVPMEPFGYPSINPGKRTLLATPSNGDNLDNLMWFMSRFSGYVGVTNYMGARLAADDAALRPILSELKKRGLVFLDDGSISDGFAKRLGPSIGIDTARASLIIDSSSSTEDIVANLKQLEDRARAGTIALGTGTGLATTIEAINGWLRDLNARGVVLVPASSLFRARAG